MQNQHITSTSSIVHNNEQIYKRQAHQPQKLIRTLTKTTLCEMLAEVVMAFGYKTAHFLENKPFMLTRKARASQHLPGLGRSLQVWVTLRQEVYSGEFMYLKQENKSHNRDKKHNTNKSGQSYKDQRRQNSYDHREII